MYTSIIFDVYLSLYIYIYMYTYIYIYIYVFGLLEVGIWCCYRLLDIVCWLLENYNSSVGRHARDRRHAGPKLVLYMILVCTIYILQPLTINIAKMTYAYSVSTWLPQCVTYSVTDQTPHSSCHGEAENHLPRSATQKHKSYFEFRNGSGTSFRHPNANPKAPTQMYSQSRAQV